MNRPLTNREKQAGKKIVKAIENYNERWRNRITTQRVQKNDYVTWKTPNGNVHRYQPSTLLNYIKTLFTETNNLNINTLRNMMAVNPEVTFIDPYTRTNVKFRNVRFVRPAPVRPPVRRRLNFSSVVSTPPRLPARSRVRSRLNSSSPQYSRRRLNFSNSNSNNEPVRRSPVRRRLNFSTSTWGPVN